MNCLWLSVLILGSSASIPANALVVSYEANVKKEDAGAKSARTLQVHEHQTRAEVYKTPPSDAEISEYFHQRRLQSFVASAALLATTGGMPTSDPTQFSQANTPKLSGLPENVADLKPVATPDENSAFGGSMEAGAADLEPERDQDYMEDHDSTEKDAARSHVDDIMDMQTGEADKQAVDSEEEQLDDDCHAPVSSPPSFVEDAPDVTARQAVWFLKHLEAIPAEVADSLLDLEGKHDERFRQEASRYVESVANFTCLSPILCLDIASRMLVADEGGCTKGRLLARLREQLDRSWRQKLFEKDSQDPRPRLSKRDDILTSSQLAVRYWGQSLISDAVLDNNHLSGRFSLYSRLSRRHLENLVDAMLDPSADILGMTRTFLSAAHKQAESISGSNVLIPLLRLNQEQRSALTREALVRDAAVVGFYEGRVAALETDAMHSLDNSEVVANWDAIEEKMDTLLEHVQRAASDHINVLPGDTGVLPAFWIGRLERVRRRLEDKFAGRSQPRPTVLIWTCSFGGGHWAATKALEQYLRDYNVVVSDPSKDREYYEGDSVGDWIRNYITPKWDETYIFNELVLKQRRYKLENTLESLQSYKNYIFGDGTGTRFAASCPAPKCNYQSKQLMRRALLRAAPDFVVTVYHMDLLPIIELCSELGKLPIMHLATDADTKMWEVFGSRPEYPHFKLGLPYGLPQAMSTIPPLTKDQTFVSGYTVRQAFMEAPRTKLELQSERLKRKIAKDALVVLVMGGSEGHSMPWPKQLADSETWNATSLHVIVVVGSNNEFGNKLESSLTAQEQADGHLLLKGSNRLVTLEVAKDPANAVGKRTAYFVPETELATLMDLADILITKAGGSTTAEAAYRGLPVLFDATDGMLKWEAFTAKMFEEHGRGKRLMDNSDLEDDILKVVTLGKNRVLVTLHTGQLVNTTAQIRAQISLMRNSAMEDRQKPVMASAVLSTGGQVMF